MSLTCFTISLQWAGMEHPHDGEAQPHLCTKVHFGHGSTVLGGSKVINLLERKKLCTPYLTSRQLR